MQMLRLAACFALAFIVISCGGGSDKGISSDIIRNPATGVKNAKKQKVPKIEFKEERYEFGAISKGEVVRHTFEFTNVGNAPFVISNIYGDCGCTVIKDWEKEPIEPGESSSFEAVFSSESKEGQQNIRVYLAGNTVPPQNITVLSGFVITPNTKQP